MFTFWVCRGTSEKKIRQGRGYDAELVIGESEETLCGGNWILSCVEIF